MKKLKVGVICYPSLGGSGVVATELGIMMANKGHEMHFITSSMPFRFLNAHPNMHFHEVTIEGYSVFKYPPYDIALANRIAQVIESEEFGLAYMSIMQCHMRCRQPLEKIWLILILALLRHFTARMSQF